MGAYLGCMSAPPPSAAQRSADPLDTSRLIPPMPENAPLGGNLLRKTASSLSQMLLSPNRSPRRSMQAPPEGVLFNSAFFAGASADDLVALMQSAVSVDALDESQYAYVGGVTLSTSEGQQLAVLHDIVFEERLFVPRTARNSEESLVTTPLQGGDRKQLLSSSRRASLADYLMGNFPAFDLTRTPHNPAGMVGISAAMTTHLAQSSLSFSIFLSQFAENRARARMPKALRRVAVLSLLTDLELEALRSVLDYRKLNFGDVVQDSSFLAVCDGQLELVVKQDELGIRSKLPEPVVVRAGEWMGELAFFKSKYLPQAATTHEYRVTVPGVALAVPRDVVLTVWRTLSCEQTRARIKAEALSRRAEALKRTFAILSVLPDDVVARLSAHAVSLRLLPGESPGRSQLMYLVHTGAIEVEGEMRRKSVGGALVLNKYTPLVRKVSQGQFFGEESVMRLLVTRPYALGRTMSNTIGELPRRSSLSSSAMLEQSRPASSGSLGGNEHDAAFYGGSNSGPLLERSGTPIERSGPPVERSVSMGDLVRMVSELEGEALQQSTGTLPVKAIEPTTVIAFPAPLLAVAFSRTPSLAAEFEIRVLREHASFDAIVNHDVARVFLGEFLSEMYADENLDFWVAAKQYEAKWLKQFLNVADEEQSAERHAEALRVYRQFVAQGAPQQINIDSALRTAIGMLVQAGSAAPPPPDVFAHAVHEIHRLMMRDAFPRFRRHPLFEKALRRVNSVHGDASSAFGFGLPRLSREHLIIEHPRTHRLSQRTSTAGGRPSSLPSTPGTSPTLSSSMPRPSSPLSPVTLEPSDELTEKRNSEGLRRDSRLARLQLQLA